MSAILERIIASAKFGKLSAMIGAGVSVKPPACAPGWHQLRDEMLDAIATFLLQDMYSGAGLLRYAQRELKDSSVGPEMLFEAIDRFSGMSRVVSFAHVVNSGHPNAAHYAISALARAGALRHLVTTNWDTYLEKALREDNPLQVISSDDEYKVIRGDARWLLHLHGSLKSSFIQGGLYRLGYSLLPQVNQCLRNILAESDLLVLGYSGDDYDVFPNLKEHFEGCSNNLYWLYLESDGPGQNAQSLAEAFPDRVYLVAMDLHCALARICEELDLSIGGDPKLVALDRGVILEHAARELGHIGCYLCMAFLCASQGQWKHAMQIAEFAADAAHSTSLYPTHTPHDLASEAYRYAAACSACAHDFRYAEFLLRTARNESNQLNKSWAESSKNVMVLDLQQGSICLCKGSLDNAASCLLRVLGMIRAERFLFRSADWPMLNAAAAQAYATVLAIVESDLGDAIQCNEAAYLAQLTTRNVWGSCAGLLSLALCYHRSGRQSEAQMALEDCLALANANGNLVCVAAAQANLDLLSSGNKIEARDIVPVVDSGSGWHLVIDPFALFVRWQSTD